jgi:hypothetical protein
MRIQKCSRANQVAGFTDRIPHLWIVRDDWENPAGGNAQAGKSLCYNLYTSTQPHNNIARTETKWFNGRATDSKEAGSFFIGEGIAHEKQVRSSCSPPGSE